MNDLPALPPLDQEQVAAWSAAHGAFAEAERASSPPVIAVSRRLLRRLLIEGLANVQPVLADVDHPMLFPPRRRYLTDILEQRVAGAAATFGYLDVAVSMQRMAGGPEVVTGCMPQVLNALLTGPVTERETNPGLLRMTSTHWKPDANPFRHPDAPYLSDLLAGAVDLAVHAPAPAVARAGWLAFVMMTVHPFVDGNGRTARALFVALSGVDTDTGLDWGAVEQWGLDRGAYVRALQAGQQVERYAGADVDPGPFMTYAADTSTRGARMNVARLHLLDELAASLDSELGGPGDVELLMRVMIDRFVPLDTFLDEADDPTEAMAGARALIGEGYLQLDEPPAGQPRTSNSGRGLVIGERPVAVAEQLRRTRYSDT